MTMKYHKIRNVEKSVCAAEQKIAYNIAWGINLSWGDEYRAALEDVAAIAASEARTKLRDRGMENWKLSRSFDDRYDLDAIFSSLNAGLKEYLEHPFIATSYDQIGEAFPALYPV